ncbi:MAG: 4-hydroxythreonine-4-phosphate dehydrogenase PdxA [Planctomycetota bacterium]
MRHRTTLALTMGDPSGIGPEVCLKATAPGRLQETAAVIFGSAEVLRRAAEQWRTTTNAPIPPVPPIFDSLEEATDAAAAEGAAVFDVTADLSAWRPGEVDAATGRASYAYIMAAIEAALAGRVDGVVTGPIHKEALRAAGVPFPGHTEIFESLTGATRACMMLTSEELSCSFVTTHVGLRDVPGLLSEERVYDVLELTSEAMHSVLGRPPKLAICGLNPHAGEGGLFGDREEERFVIPAVERIRATGIEVEGPLPPDTAFLPGRRARTDAFVCMYHDQGHIPLKALSFETAVNTTLGLPIVRTSVDHGTALDIAWKSFSADATSLSEAISLAVRLALGRQARATEAAA